MNTIVQNIALVRANIAAAAKEAQRDIGSITLLAVSKTHSPEAIAAAAATGITDFGESYLQEALPKIQALNHLKLTWHYIGRLQSNKAKAIATNFAWVQTVASFNMAELLAKYRPAALPPLNICIQVNISNEPNKAGVSCDAILPLATQLSQLPHLKLRGLMAIPANLTDYAAQLAVFQQMHQEFVKLRATGFNVDTLSIGMSHDYPAAIAAGSTLVRIGTAIFGERCYP